MLITAPCKNCTGRYTGCHSKCEKYKEFKRKAAEEQATIRSARHKLYNTDNYK